MGTHSPQPQSQALQTIFQASAQVNALNLVCLCPLTNLYGFLVPSGQKSPILSLTFKDLQELSRLLFPIKFFTILQTAWALSHDPITKMLPWETMRKTCNSVRCWVSSVPCTGLDAPWGGARS